MFLLLFSQTAHALPDLKLITPNLKRGLGLAQTLQVRHSDRNFSSSVLSIQDLSDLLWSVGGINRASTGGLVNPTAKSSHDIQIYAAFEQAIYLYDPKQNLLRVHVEGDFRRDISTADQPTVAKAPVIILIVSNYTTFSGITNEEQIRWAALDSGIVAASAVLFASSNGYNACVRGHMDIPKVREVLKLKPEQLLQLNVPIGLPPA
jgi:hypothetical protein